MLSCKHSQALSTTYKTNRSVTLIVTIAIEVLDSQCTSHNRKLPDTLIFIQLVPSTTVHFLKESSSSVVWLVGA